ncbi:MAG: tetratricopeptide repeat protein [Ignavibacteria bacterium]
MSAIPTGNVTFLFTDIEGSTMLSQEFPETLPAALEKHHAILRDAIESNSGFVFEIIGDAFCAAFENANDAVKAACTAQLDLANEKWNDAVIKARMGIHSGKAEWNGKRYSGYITLARTARVMSAAYGGQILISGNTHEPAKENIGDKISFRDLGERRLKDVIQPIHLFQIISPGLREDFPPLKTLDARPNNLPVLLTGFIGREKEMERVKDLIKQSHLLTLTGSGGSGKTRLALQVAADIIDDYSNGVWLIELASLSDPFLLVQTIFKMLDLQEQPMQNTEDTLLDYLKDKEILLILDNCEHIIDATAQLTEKLLSKSPKLKIIATSREALRTAGEQTHRILPMNVPDPKNNESPEILAQYEAVKLFIEGALAVDENFRIQNENAAAIAGICNRLDGIPLAIELAAAKIKVLSAVQIYERLDNRFALLSGGKRTALPRQQTLRAMIDWSYDLLSENEKILWYRLAVFSGGWTIEAAEEICSDEKISIEELVDLLTLLAEKSIIIFSPEKVRFRILETIRQFGEEKLKVSDEYENISDKHLNYYMILAESAEPKLKGPDQRVWLEKLDKEAGNFEKSFNRSLNKKNSQSGLRIAGAVELFWDIRGIYSEGLRWLESILEHNSGVINSIQGKALNAAGVLNTFHGNFKKAQKFLETALAIHVEIKDEKGIACSLLNLGRVLWFQGELSHAADLCEHSLGIFRNTGDKRGTATCLISLGIMSLQEGNYDRSEKLFEEGLAINRDAGDKREIAYSLLNMGMLSSDRGEMTRAAKLFEESLSIQRTLGDKRRISVSLNSLGVVAKELGELARSEELFEESLAIRREIGNKLGVANSLDNLGNVAFSRDQFDRAQSLFEESLELFREVGSKPGIASSLEGLGRIALKKKEYNDAEKYYRESLALNSEAGSKRDIAINLLGFSELKLIEGSYNGASELLGFIEKFFGSGKMKLSKHERERFERVTSEVKEKLKDEEYLKSFEKGKEMTMELLVASC